MRRPLLGTSIVERLRHTRAYESSSTSPPMPGRDLPELPNLARAGSPGVKTELGQRRVTAAANVAPEANMGPRVRRRPAGQRPPSLESVSLTAAKAGERR